MRPTLADFALGRGLFAFGTFLVLLAGGALGLLVLASWLFGPASGGVVLCCGRC